MTTTTYPHTQLQAFAEAIFRHMGCTAQDATIAAEVLVMADLRGIDSHGISRLQGYYALWKAGRINPTPDIRVVHESPSTATVDGDSGLGLVVAPWAMKLAIDKAYTAGSGWVAVRNSNHFGIAGAHAMQALDHDMVGWAMTNATAFVAPTQSAERLLGTNPIAVALPAGEEPPFVADLATATAARGKLEILERRGEPSPTGWVQDDQGQESTDPTVLAKGGALLPLGGDQVHGGHKGYALGALVDLLSGVLGGAAFGPWVPPFVPYVKVPPESPGEGLGHFFGAMRVDGFQSVAAYKQGMDTWLRRFRGSTPAGGHDRVLVAGDPERMKQQQRLQEGIPVHHKVVSGLKSLAEETGVPWSD